MARTNLLDTRTTNFGNLIGNGKIYQVPIFQRDYSWGEENWEDLWQDIVTLHTQPNSSHYMGALVLHGHDHSDKEFTIIDGQQRLATLSILAIAVINKIQGLIDQGQQADVNQERQTILRRTYLGDKDPRSLTYSSKLILNASNNAFYQDNLINLRKPYNIRSLSQSNQLIWEAFEYFSEALDALQTEPWTGEALAGFLTNTVAEGLLFIQIDVEDQLKAYTVFETLNARGIELSSTDLLKNYLFSLFQGPDDLQRAQRQWKRIIDTVQMEKFPEFLRYYLSTQINRVRRDRLFKLVRASVKDAQQAFDLLDQLDRYGGLFVALGNSNDDFWLDHPRAKPYVRELVLFRVKQSYPILFAAHKKFSSEDFVRLLKLICIFSFRYTIVSSLNPNALEKRYNELAIAITQGDITSPRQVFDRLHPLAVPDEKFIQDFSLLAIPTKGQKKKLVRYILWKLEKDASGGEVDEDGFSIEHILPESPSQAWQSEFTDAQIDALMYRLGNLTPLEASLNRQVGNGVYAAKRAAYRDSRYELTQKILPEDWSPDTVISRQNQLAKRAAHIWQADFG
ncbi:MAG: DUF262 domain-containing protein [Cyanobacteria bacterium]|nr:DUF262 domain-containing protein [Cyanobacteriota bacterium]